MADETPTQQAVELTDELRGWINEQLSVEVKRVESMGSKCLPVPVFDFCTEQGEATSDDKSLVHVITAKTKYVLSPVFAHPSVYTYILQV